MSTTAIRAGKAWVELSLRDKIDAGLKRAQLKLLSWGTILAKLGGVITAATGSMIGAMTLAAKHFADAGSAIFDMSQATGVGAETLSALGYAAEQSGASLADVATAMKGIAKLTLGVSTGSKAANATLKQLGISATAFLAASPEQRLGMIADGLLNIEDPSLRSAVAMSALGRSAQSLGSMLAEGSAGIAAMTARARELGLVMTDAEVQKADALGDAWDDVKKVFWSLAFKVGAALADSLTQIFDVVARTGAVVGEFIRNNERLVVLFAMGTLVATGFGAALIGIAGSLFVLAGVVAGVNAAVAIATGLWAALGVVKTVLTAINAFLAMSITTTGIAAAFASVKTFLLAAATNILTGSVIALKAVLAVLLAPLTLLIVGLAALSAALIAGAVYFFMYTEAGQWAVETLTGNLWGLLATASQTMQGIFDAIMAGNWQLAGGILMMGLNVSIKQGIFQLQALWSGFKVWMTGLFADMFAGLFAQLASFQQGLVDSINGIREQLGLEGNVKGFAGIDNLAGKTQAGADQIKSAAKKRADADILKAWQEFADAQTDLDAAVKHAAQARAAKQPKTPTPPTPGDFSGLPGGVAGSASGTFNAAIAGLLSSSGESAAERTAANTDEMKDDLAAMRSKLDEGLLEATA